MIYVNEVYKNANNNEYIRIIDIDHNNDIFYFVLCFKTYAYPKPYKINLFIDEISRKLVIKVPDIFMKVIDENLISKSDIEKREYYWQIVDKYWNDSKEELSTDGKRRKLFKSISEEYKISESTVKRVFSRFFERGMNKNSLLTQYYKSGGKGKEKTLDKSKIGRPKKFSKNEGINITDDIKIIFQQGIDNYYYNEKNNNIKEVYTAILRDFFSYKYYENNELKYTLFEEDRLPSYGQFYYWFKKFHNQTKDIITRQSVKEFELKNRPILSNSTLETIGPGTRFQVDATIADIYLVSKFDRDRIIGRPIVYAIIDVFSRMVTGIYVGLEGPSWIGAMMALDNMVTDKVEFCKEYGIEIEEYQWPAYHLPQIIIADRGEFEGYSVENLINNLGIAIENTPPYRGDLKGIVERSFSTVNTKIKYKTPGAIMKEYRKRGDRDYRLDATLTLEEFTKIYIKLVIQHNNTIIEKYPMGKDMIADEIAPIQTQLWQWGIRNKKGSLRIIGREIMRLNVMPKAKASVSRSGIRFKGLERGFEVYGVDFSKTSIECGVEIAKKKSLNVKFLCQSIFDFQDKHESFDFIYDSGCLHHIKPHRRNEYIKTILKYLKPDGYFAMACFNLKGGANISDYDVYREYSMHGGLGFSKYKLKTILEPYFDIVEFREMVESTDENVFGKSFMWTVLMKKK